MADDGNNIDSESSIAGDDHEETQDEQEVPSMTERPGDAHESFDIVNNANDDFERGVPESSMTERPGDAYVGTNIVSNANDDFERGVPESSMTKGDAYVGTNIVSNANDDFSRNPTGPSITERPGDAYVSSSIVNSANNDSSQDSTVPSMTARPGFASVNTNIASNVYGNIVRESTVPPMTAKPGVAHVNTNNVCNANYLDRPKANSFTHHPTDQHKPAHRPVLNAPQNPAQDKPFTVDVKNHFNSKTYQFQVRNSTLVDELMRDIESRLPGDLPPSQQRLIYAGKNMEEGKTMSYYKVEPNQTILLTGRLRGG